MWNAISALQVFIYYIIFLWKSILYFDNSCMQWNVYCLVQFLSPERLPESLAEEQIEPQTFTAH